MLAKELVYVGAIPLAVAAIVAIAARRVRLPSPMVWATGVGVGYISGQLALAARDGGVARAVSTVVRPREAADWLPLAVFLALGATVLIVGGPRNWRRWTIALAAMLTVCVPLRLLAGSAYVTIQWSAWEKIAYIALLSATFALTWLMLASAHDEVRPRLRALLLIVVAAASALVVALSGVLVYGELCGVAAAALAGTALATMLGRGVDGAAGVVTFSLGSIIVLAYFYGELVPTNAAMIFLSLVFAAGRLPELISSWTPRLQAAARIALCLTPLAIALARAILAAQASLATNPYAA